MQYCLGCFLAVFHYRKPASKPAIQPARQPASQPGSHAASQQAGRQASRQAGSQAGRQASKQHPPKNSVTEPPQAHPPKKHFNPAYLGQHSQRKVAPKNHPKTPPLSPLCGLRSQPWSFDVSGSRSLWLAGARFEGVPAAGNERLGQNPWYPG